jgi:WD40-like Beta Propeller Repeat
MGRIVAAAIAVVFTLPAHGSAQQLRVSVEQIAAGGGARHVLLADGSWVAGPLDAAHVLRVVPQGSGATIESLAVLTGARRLLARADGPPHAVAVAGDRVAFGTCVPAERSCVRSAVWVAHAGAMAIEVAEVAGSLRSIAWSGDGRRLAVTATLWCGVAPPEGCNTNRLWLVAADGSSVVQVGYHGRAGSFSRDGRYLAYVGVREGGSRDRVWIDDLRTSSLRSVALGRVALWSPTRDELLVGGGPSILLVRPDGTRQLLARAALFYRSLWWAPNGREIAFAAQGSPLTRLFVARLRPPRLRLLSTRVYDPPLAWSPDGTRLAYAARTRQQTVAGDRFWDSQQLFVAGLTLRPRRVSAETSHDVQFGSLWWSQDGTRIRYLARR